MALTGVVSESSKPLNPNENFISLSFNDFLLLFLFVVEWLIILGDHGGQYSGFFYMAPFILVEIQYGMKLDIKLPLNQDFQMKFFIKLEVL